MKITHLSRFNFDINPLSNTKFLIVICLIEITYLISSYINDPVSTLQLKPLLFICIFLIVFQIY